MAGGGIGLYEVPLSQLNSEVEATWFRLVLATRPALRTECAFAAGRAQTPGRIRKVDPP